MIEIQEMTEREIEELLDRLNYGHLAVCRNNLPYVVPIHFIHASPDIYIYTTEGKKTEMIRSNPEICLQAEDVTDNKNWQSVIVSGTAVFIDDPGERDNALKAILEINPTLTPAVSIRWMDSWVRENIEVILRITPRMRTGRRTVERSETEAPFVPGERERIPNIY